MRRFRFKTIRMRVLVFVIPIIILTMLVLSFFTYMNSKDLINREIDHKMNYQLDRIISIIEMNLEENSKIPVSLARTVETTGSVMTKEHYKSIIKEYVGIDKQIVGGGIWFEPYKYDSELKYFGPYAYRDNGQIVYSEELSTPEYDYHNWDWYLIGKNTNKQVVWSDPYVDVTGITMITATAPFYDQKNNFLGVTTVDMDLFSLQELVQNVKVGNTGKAFLIDSQGIYIADVDSSKIMNKNIIDSTNRSLANLGKEMLKGKRSVGTFIDDNGENIVYYEPVPEIGWMLALSISEKELHAPLKNLINKLILPIVVSIIFVLGVVLYILTITFKPLKEVVANMAQAETGDLTVVAENKGLKECWTLLNCDKRECPAYKSDNLRCWQVAGTHCNGQIQGDMASKIKECEQCEVYKAASGDEVKRITMSFNNMICGFKSMMREIIEVSDHVAASSEELSATGDQVGQTADQVGKAIQDVASGAEEQSAQIDETAKQVEKLFAEISDIETKTLIIKKEADNVIYNIESGNKSVVNSIHQINNVKKSATETENVIKVLGKKSEEISKIIELISNIASQTNLLALNAAIEAARAGEAGRGFSVVADEIRKLAENSANASEKIVDLINEIQEGVSKAITKTSESIDVVEEGTKAIKDTGEIFEEIKSLAQRVHHLIEEVTQNTQEMNHSGEYAKQTINDIAIVSEQFSSNAEEVAASNQEQLAATEEIIVSANKLAEMANDLIQVVNKFKV